MKNTNLKQIAFIAVMGLFLNACGGGSNTYTPPDEVKVPQCTETPVDVTGKTIKKVLDGAEVKISHFPNGTKLACMISGAAIIVDN